MHAAVAFVLVAVAAAAQDSPCTAGCDDGLDRGIDGGEDFRPVFVRMQDQRFADAAAYPAFCRAHLHTPRSLLRARVRADLQQRADASWQAVEVAVNELRRAGDLRQVERFWICNGFAAAANAVAVQRLRQLEGIAWVHRQTQPGAGQHERAARDADFVRDGEAAERLALQQLAQRGDEGPFAPAGLVVPWNLEHVRAPAAWALGATGAGVVVGLLDTGVLEFEPLVHALWRNPGESLDGVDNDGNGRVDDLFGWDFDGNTPLVVGDGAQSHGTMCGGIIAGRPWGAPKTVTGLAPRAQLMVLRGMGRLAAYEYAAQMGADVLSMSYMWVGVELGSWRSVYRTAHEHLAACGVTAVGGAGNFGTSHPAGRQIALPKDIPCVIAAAGVGRDGTVPAFSSRGPCTWDTVPFFFDYPAALPLGKPDVTGCCMEFPVWHRTTVARGRAEVRWQDGRGFGLIEGPRGNSFAGPHAAGVAALMLSVNAELTPWRVQGLMAASCRDLGEPGRDLVHGAGLLQADAAVRAARDARVE